VRDTVENALGQRPLGPIRLLTHLRYFGYCFNPISVFYCFDDKGDSIETLVAEVTNTPWSERRLYVLGAPTPSGIPASVRFAKTLHVSPFMPMDLEYVWRSDIPGDRLSIHMNVVRGDDPLLDATLALQRENITGHHLAMSLLRQPLMTLKVIAGIHWEAVRLWLKGVPVFDHPAKASAPGRSENITHR
jgi:DUF1365 family protein